MILLASDASLAAARTSAPAAESSTTDTFAPMDGRSNLFAADNFQPAQAGRVIYAELVADVLYPNWKPLDG